MEQKQNFIENNLTILSKATLDLLLSQPNPSDLIGLYVFYYYTAKWQGTNQPKATSSYVRKGLGWGSDKYQRTSDKLVELGLIEKVRTFDDVTGKVTGWYIKMNYLWSKEKENHITQNPHVAKPRCGKQATNALSVNNINALSDNNKMLVEEKERWTDEDIQMTIYLLERVRENFPFIKTSYSEADLIEMNRLHRIGGYDYQLIRGVIDWATTDSFWKQNIRSVSKLRHQFENLLVRIKSAKDSQPKVLSI